MIWPIAKGAHNCGQSIGPPRVSLAIDCGQSTDPATDAVGLLRARLYWRSNVKMTVERAQSVLDQFAAGASSKTATYPAIVESRCIGQLSQENASSSTNSASFRSNVIESSGDMSGDSGRGRKLVTFNQNARSPVLPDSASHREGPRHRLVRRASRAARLSCYVGLRRSRLPAPRPHRRRCISRLRRVLRRDCVARGRVWPRCAHPWRRPDAPWRRRRRSH